MLSVVNQNGDTKLDIKLYYKKCEVKCYSIVAVENEHNYYLAQYSTKEQCDEVFEQMLEFEEKTECIYRLPKDEPERYR